jgi:uncharacterized protein YjbJ (UPF0337 family)
MNKDRANGILDEAVGTAKRKAGELTGDTPLQIKGIAQQVKGKLENGWGKAKEAVRETAKGARTQNGSVVGSGASGDKSRKQ